MATLRKAAKKRAKQKSRPRQKKVVILDDESDDEARAKAKVQIPSNLQTPTSKPMFDYIKSYARIPALRKQPPGGAPGGQ